MSRRGGSRKRQVTAQTGVRIATAAKGSVAPENVRAGESSTASQGIRSHITYTNDMARAKLTQIVERELAPRHIVAMAGAPPGASIQVFGSFITAEWEEGGHRYQTQVIITRRDPEDYGAALPEGSELTLGNFGFVKDGDEGARMEAQLLSRQLPIARELGITFMTAKCRSGSSDWETLAQLGYNAILDKYLGREMRGAQIDPRDIELPSGVNGPTLQDVLQNEEGRNFWHDLGPMYPTYYFDVRLKSSSVRTLKAYIKAGGQ